MHSIMNHFKYYLSTVSETTMQLTADFHEMQLTFVVSETSMQHNNFPILTSTSNTSFKSFMHSVMIHFKH
jgi:hypothetical protein